MLERMPNVRIVCADNGVKGEFRVRDLEPIMARDGVLSTLTQVKEHGHTITIDPTKSYFSTRLSTERHNYSAAKRLSSLLNRLTVCDPAGVSNGY